LGIEENLPDDQTVLAADHFGIDRIEDLHSGENRWSDAQTGICAPVAMI
jgi:hypothetical protein